VWRELDQRLRRSAGPKAASDEEPEKLIADLSARYRPSGKSKRRNDSYYLINWVVNWVLKPGPA
jgi:hypothetical protein